jgi:hypothetical protein
VARVLAGKEPVMHGQTVGFTARESDARFVMQSNPHALTQNTQSPERASAFHKMSYKTWHLQSSKEIPLLLEKGSVFIVALVSAGIVLKTFSSTHARTQYYDSVFLCLLRVISSLGPKLLAVTPKGQCANPSQCFFPDVPRGDLFPKLIYKLRSQRDSKRHTRDALFCVNRARLMNFISINFY